MVVLYQPMPKLLESLHRQGLLENEPSRKLLASIIGLDMDTEKAQMLDTTIKFILVTWASSI